MEEEAIEDGALPSVMVGGSRRKVLLHLQQKSMVRFLGSDGVALNGEPGGGHKCDIMGVRGRSSMGGGRERGENPPPPQRWIRPPWHGQRRRRAVIGACALSIVSAVTVW
jgi:hypothetical protein